LPSHKSRPGNNRRATSAARPDRRAFHQPRRLMPCQVPSKCVAPLGGANARESRSNREGAMPLSSRAADRACCVNDGMARQVLGPRINFRSDGARLWNRPYTLWRADRPAICGRDEIVR
jgi:hypothetical protein